MVLPLHEFALAPVHVVTQVFADTQVAERVNFAGYGIRDLAHVGASKRVAGKQHKFCYIAGFCFNMYTHF